MALLCSGSFRVHRVQLLLYCSILSLIIYFLHSRRAPSPQNLSPAKIRTKPGLNSVQVRTTAGLDPVLVQTSWGAPVVWGDSEAASRRRESFSHIEVHTALLTLVVGTYARYVDRFLSSAERYFLIGRRVTYYFLTDNPRTLDPPPDLPAHRTLMVVPIAELPGWDRLYLRRGALIADTIQNTLDREVDYLFCVDVDLVFMAPVGEEILGELVGTLHSERSTVDLHDNEDKGSVYYSSEIYGGSPREVHRLVQTMSRLMLQDQAAGELESGLEESYLNRVLVERRPGLVLSPEYDWWEGAHPVHTPRLVSRGRQCDTLDAERREKKRC